ncbi:MAG: type II toxin-antitoxin system antitoxin SocA domain-containing protein [Sulfuricellaceae bacterium]
MITAIEAANYFLSKQDSDEPDISNLKLLKLVYYGQAWSLAFRSRPLFAEQLEAWQHGPVAPSVYQKFKSNGGQAIAKPETQPELPEADRELLDMVYAEYAQYSAWHLRQLTHSEPPWKDAHAVFEGAEISMDSISRFFREKLNATPPDFERLWERSQPIDDVIALLAA